MLRVLRERGSASTAELVGATGLHENTVREHLARLHRDGRIRRVQDAPVGRGRPRWRWHPLDDSIDPAAGLAIALMDALAGRGGDPATAAREAGVEWGARIAEQLGADRSADPREFVIEIMRQQGFAPDAADAVASDAAAADTVATTADALTTTVPLALRHCPLLSAARHSRVTCAVHEGLIEGLASAGGDAVRAQLEPFAANGACLVHLRAAS